MALVKEFIQLDKNIAAHNQDVTKGFYIVNKEDKLFQLNTIPQSRMNLPVDEIKGFSQTILFDEEGMRKLVELFSAIVNPEKIEYQSWILSSNPNYYDVIGAFRKHNMVDWGWYSPNARVGDYVYIYISGNVKRIVIKTKITIIDVPREQLFDDKEFYVNTDDARVFDEKYTRLELVKEDTTEQLDLENLRNHSLKGNLQGPRRLDGALLRFVESVFSNDEPRQIIYYGAPGTGKSHGIKKQLAGVSAENIFRTTFHPDSDYSTFVGAYKPTMEEGRIIYSFVAQTFLQAYIRAYKTDEPVYLIIEEINRGNCAQIFGDLFQLLDRSEDGWSEYGIKADADIFSFLQQKLGADREGIKNGELRLPSNLYILATMNTSDQSLFPIDSAFKRRWDWKYIPICDAGKAWMVKVDGVEYDWWDFVERINRKIWDATHSEDKKLGYFFCKADEQGVIAADKFVGKVLFYVYNDVFKDYGLDDEIFKDEDGSELLFHKYFNPDGSANEKKIRVLLENMKVKHGDSDNGGEAAKE